LQFPEKKTSHTFLAFFPSLPVTEEIRKFMLLQTPQSQGILEVSAGEAQSREEASISAKTQGNVLD
jgi:hypothetical protein